MSAPSAIELRQHLLFEKQVLLASRLPDALAEDALEHFPGALGLDRHQHGPPAQLKRCKLGRRRAGRDGSRYVGYSQA
jgi:hypothetical protein